MSRVEKAAMKIKELYGEAGLMHGNENDLEMLYECFAYGDVYGRTLLDDRQREMITLVVLTVNQTMEQLAEHVHAALNAGLKPVEIQEALIQCAPYIGFSRVLEALSKVDETLKAEGFELPLASQRITTEADRFEKGLAVQKSIFGEKIDQLRANAAANQMHIQDYLSAMCFGDFYTRGTLDVKTRELITLCVLASLGGCESQLKSHVNGNYVVGNSKELMIEAVSVCLIHIGFPRTLNALSCINEVLPE